MDAEQGGPLPEGTTTITTSADVSDALDMTQPIGTDGLLHLMNAD